MSKELVRELVQDYFWAGREHDLTRSQLIEPYGIGAIDSSIQSPVLYFGSMCNYIGEFLGWQFVLKLKELDLRDKPDDFFLDPLNLLTEGFDFDPSAGYVLSLVKEASQESQDMYRVISVAFREGHEPTVVPGTDYQKVDRFPSGSKNNKEVIETMVGLFAENVIGPTRKPIGWEVTKIPRPLILPR